VNNVLSINERPQPRSGKSLSHLVNALVGNQGNQILAQNSFPKSPLKQSDIEHGRLTAACSVFRPLLWESATAARQGEPGNVSTNRPGPGRLRSAWVVAIPQFDWESCGYPDSTIQHITTDRAI